MPIVRNLVLSTLKAVPKPISRRLKNLKFMQRAYRGLFNRVVGEGEEVVIRSGPLRGLRMVTGPSITHAQINGTYEADLAECLGRILQPGTVCYDLGASTGYFSLLMAKTARKVYAFEPTPHAAKWVRLNADANQFAHVEIVPSVVSDCEKTVVFQMTGMGYGSQVVEAAKVEDRYQRLELRSITLDDFASKHEPPDLMKIDIEGEEGNALSGAESILREKRPIICCEIHDLANASRVAEILGRHKYKITALDGSAFAMPTSIHPGDFHILARPD